MLLEGWSAVGGNTLILVFMTHISVFIHIYNFLDLLLDTRRLYTQVKIANSYSFLFKQDINIFLFEIYLLLLTIILGATLDIVSSKISSTTANT